MTPHSPEACARENIPYTPEWREPVDGRLSNMEIEERIARRRLVQNEPEHAAVERALYRGSRKKGLVRVGTAEYSEAWWKHEWRSMPDYDGGGNALSGVRWWVHADSDGFERSGPLDPGEQLTAWSEHLDATKVERRVPSGREKREIRIYEEATNVYVLPIKGGRGWCPLLAEAE